jgi:hypothetical protein
MILVGTYRNANMAGNKKKSGCVTRRILRLLHVHGKVTQYQLPLKEESWHSDSFHPTYKAAYIFSRGHAVA